MVCSIYGWVSIIFFNNTPCQFPLRFIIIINNIQELLFSFYVFLRYYSTCAQMADCHAIMRSVPRCWQCSSVTARVTAAMSQVQTILQTLQGVWLYHYRCWWTVHGCSDVGRYDSLLLLHDSLFTLLRQMTVYSFETNACMLRMLRLLSDTTTWLASLWLAGEQSMSQQLG